MPANQAPIDRAAAARIHPVGSGLRFDGAEEGDRGRWRGFWGIVKRRGWIILSVLLVTVALGVIYTLRARPVYEASAKVIIGQDPPRPLTNERGAIGSGPTDEQYLPTQLNVLRSRTLAERVIDELRLRQRPAFAGPEWDSDPGWVDRDAHWRDSVLIDRFLSGLDVERLPETRIIEVRYESHDPKLAAEIVNELADQLIQYALDVQIELARRSQEWIRERLAELDPKLDQMRQELIQYRQEHQIIQPGDGGTIAVEGMADLNRHLVEAEADRIRAETLYELSQAANVDTFPPVMSDPLVQELRRRVAEDRTRLAELTRQFTDQWPEVRKLESQIEESERQLAEARQRVLAKVEADSRSALAREESLRAELEKRKAEILQRNERALTLSFKQRKLEALTRLHDGWLQKLNDLDLFAALAVSHIQILDRARVPLGPVRPLKPFNIGVSVVAGLFLGIVLALWVDRRDNTVKSTGDVDRWLGLPALGVVPARGSLRRPRRMALLRLRPNPSEKQPILTLQEPERSSFAEAFRSLRTAVLLSQAEAPPRTLLFTSSLPGEGKTTTAVNTAISLAQTGAKVLLIDGDLRKPKIHQLLKVKNQTGLSAYLTRSIELGAVIDQNQIDNLSVIAAGPIPPNPSELLSSRKMREAIGQLIQQYEFVVFDAPPASTPDALVLSTLVDGVILVIRSQETAPELARRAKQSLDRVKARIFGVVLNQADVERDEFYYYYYRYYSAEGPRQPPGLS